MRRALSIVALIAVGVAVALAPLPDESPEPLAGLIIDQPGIESPVDASIWYCPWAQANASRDSAIAVAAVADADVDLTLPVAIPGEPPDLVATQTLGPGAAIITLSDVAQRGDSPGFVEFSDGPAAAAVVVTGDVLAGDACVSQGPDEWFFAGGSTQSGELLGLRLFNPFPETAKVTVTGFSEIGVEALGELRSVSINPRSWRDIGFEELLRQRQSLVVSVQLDEGLVVPAMVETIGDDEAWWIGGDLSSEWEFPIAAFPGIDTGALVIGNPNLADVTVTIDYYTADGPQRSALELVVPSFSPVRLELGSFPGSPVGVRIASSAPVTAGLVASGEAGTVATGGAAATSTSWLLPGLRSDGVAEARLWLMNSGFEQTSVTVSELTGAAAVNSQVLLEPGTLLAVELTEPDALGVLVEASEPFTAAWSLVGPAGAAVVPGLDAADE
jgi:hypothetical protein